MSEERKKALWPLVIVLLIGLPVFYVASYGPVIWLWQRQIFPPRGWIRSSIIQTYYPIVCVQSVCPEPIAKAIRWYVKLGMDLRPRRALESEYWPESET